jgi:hypothetical protein
MAGQFVAGINAGRVLNQPELESQPIGDFVGRMSERTGVAERKLVAWTGLGASALAELHREVEIEVEYDPATEELCFPDRFDAHL